MQPAKKKITIQTKPIYDYQNITQRLIVQSPKAEPLQEIKNNQVKQVEKKPKTGQ